MDTIAQENIKYTLSTQAIEHAFPSKDTIRLCERLSDGTISANRAVDIIKEKYGIVKSEYHNR